MKPTLRDSNTPFFNDVNAQAKVGHDEELIARVRKRSKRTYQESTHYAKIGDGIPNYKGVSVDLLKVFLGLIGNLKAHWSLLTLLEKRDKYNVVFLPRSSLTNAEYQRLVKGLPILVKQHFVLRLGHERYMINPDLMQPDMYDDAIAKWNSLIKN